MQIGIPIPVTVAMLKRERPDFEDTDDPLYPVDPATMGIDAELKAFLRLATKDEIRDLNEDLADRVRVCDDIGRLVDVRLADRYYKLANIDDWVSILKGHGIVEYRDKWVDEKGADALDTVQDATIITAEWFDAAPGLQVRRLGKMPTAEEREERRALTDAQHDLARALAWEEVARDLLDLEEHTLKWLRAMKRMDVPSDEPCERLDQRAEAAARDLFGLWLVIQCKAARLDADGRTHPTFGFTLSEAELVAFRRAEAPRRGASARSEHYRAVRSTVARWWSDEKTRKRAFTALYVAPTLPDSKRVKAAQAAHAAAGAIGA